MDCLDDFCTGALIPAVQEFCKGRIPLSGSAAAAQGSNGAPSQEPRRNYRAQLASLHVCMSGSLPGGLLGNLALAAFQATCAQWHGDLVLSRDHRLQLAT